MNSTHKVTTVDSIYQNLCYRHLTHFFNKWMCQVKSQFYDMLNWDTKLNLDIWWYAFHKFGRPTLIFKHLSGKKNASNECKQQCWVQNFKSMLDLCAKIWLNKTQLLSFKIIRKLNSLLNYNNLTACNEYRWNHWNL